MKINELSIPERWRAICDFPMYRVSSRGRVSSSYSGMWKVLKNRLGNKGYLDVNLFNKFVKHKTHLIHHLVLGAFVGTRGRGLVTNHKNGIKIDNRLGNLEYTTSSENANHAYSAGLRVPNSCKAVDRLTTSGQILETFKSQSEARRETGVAQSQISACCLNKRKYYTAGGFVWQFSSEE